MHSFHSRSLYTTGIANNPIVSAHPSAFDLLKCSSCSDAALFISHMPSPKLNSTSGTTFCAASPCTPCFTSSTGPASPSRSHCS